MPSNSVEDHYTRGNLQQTVIAALIAAGHDPDNLDPDVLSPAEEFHTLGRVATIALAEAAAITGDDHVLDVGSGLGGPARVLARLYGCHVTGIDLTRELCDVAVDLNRRVGMTEQIDIHCGDALQMPFDDASFDVVWTQHVSMNIGDKARLFGEMRRVAKPHARLEFFDILAGPEQPIMFPVPWATDQADSFLATSDQTHELLSAAGFAVRTWEDLTDQAVEFFATMSSASGPPPPLGIHLLIKDVPLRLGNLVRNAKENRIRVVRCIADVA